jgi:hypothetical protein
MPEMGRIGAARPGFVPGWLMPPACTASAPYFEIAVAASAGDDGAPVRSLRATLDCGFGGGTFLEKLALGRRAVVMAATGMPAGPSDTATRAACHLIDAVFPDPSAVDPRTHFATWLGVTYGVERPGEPLAIKLYVNLDAPGGDGVTGLVARWPEFARPAGIALADGLAQPRFAAVRVTETGTVSHRIYVRPLASKGHELLARVSALCGVDANMVLAAVHETGLSRALWTGDIVIKVEAPEVATAGASEPGRSSRSRAGAPSPAPSRPYAEVARAGAPGPAPTSPYAGVARAGAPGPAGASEPGRGSRDRAGAPGPGPSSPYAGVALARASATPDASFAVHLAGAVAGAPDRAWARVRPALERVVGSAEGTEELIEAGTDRSPQSWLVSGIGLGFHRDRGHHATNVYLLPAGSR